MQPEELPRHERITLLLSKCGALLTARDKGYQWIARCLIIGIETGATIERAFDLRSDAPVSHLLKRQRADRLLMRVSVICGGDKQASFALRGLAPMPVQAIDPAAELRRMSVGVSIPSFARARSRIRRRPRGDTC